MRVFFFLCADLAFLRWVKSINCVTLLPKRKALAGNRPNPFGGNTLTQGTATYPRKK